MVKRRRGRNGNSEGLLESINEDGNVVVVNEEFVNVVGGPDAPQVVKELSEQTDPLAAQRAEDGWGKTVTRTTLAQTGS